MWLKRSQTSSDNGGKYSSVLCPRALGIRQTLPDLAAVVRQDGLNMSRECRLHRAQETGCDAACRAAGHCGHAEAGGVVGRREHVVADAVAKARYRI